MTINPDIGFTADVIKDPKRFVGRHGLLSNCIAALNNPVGMIAVFGKRGVGKSSVMRQIQLLANGDYSLIQLAGLRHLIPTKPRRYLTVYYQCDSLIGNTEDLLLRIMNDTNEEDGLLRLVPDDGKEIVEFNRAKGVQVGADLKVVSWGASGVETSKYARRVQGNTVQTFRNFLDAIVTHEVKKRGYDGLLILLDEFDVIQDRSGFGSLVKSLTTANVKFGVCGISKSITGLIRDHSSVERLLQQGTIPVAKMPEEESLSIFAKAEQLFGGAVAFDPDVKNDIAKKADGYPYFVQMIGRSCVEDLNLRGGGNIINEEVYSSVKSGISNGTAMPSLESQYIQAVGESEPRKWLLYLLATQEESNTIFNDELGRVVLSKVRAEAESLGIEYVDQLIPRLVDKNYGSVIEKDENRRGLYEFANPVFRLYVRLRNI